MWPHVAAQISTDEHPQVEHRRPEREVLTSCALAAAKVPPNHGTPVTNWAAMRPDRAAAFVLAG